ncbi:MAG: holo-ACP synthase [Thiotrichales bacterium]
MAIFGIGTDIVNVARIERIYRRHPQRFAARVLAIEELEELAAVADPVAFIAKRFAVKEATAKALGTGFRDGLRYSDITVQHTALGQPRLRCFGRAANLLTLHGVTASHLSISDERDFALAFVVLEN